jgi:hypothetical protein
MPGGNINCILFRFQSQASTARTSPTQPNATANAVTVLVFVSNEASIDCTLVHISVGSLLELAVGVGVEIAEGGRVMVPLQNASPPPMVTVPLPVSQHERASLSCPQQNDPYGPQDVKTASPELSFPVHARNISLVSFSFRISLSVLHCTYLQALQCKS